MRIKADRGVVEGAILASQGRALKFVSPELRQELLPFFPPLWVLFFLVGGINQQDN